METPLEHLDISVEEMKDLTTSFFIEYISDVKHEHTDSENIRMDMIAALDTVESSNSPEDIAQILSQFKVQLEEAVKAKRNEKGVYEKLLEYIQ